MGKPRKCIGEGEQERHWEEIGTSGELLRTLEVGPGIQTTNCREREGCRGPTCAVGFLSVFPRDRVPLFFKEC